MYNLNDASFDAKAGVAIFNDGVAGIVENVTLSISKKKPEDKENAPDYKVIFKDAKGAECATSLWYVTKDTQYSTVDEQVKKQGTLLKHIIHAIYGADFQIPISAQNPQQLLDQAMKIIRDGVPNAGKLRMFANYGSTQSIKQYIQPRSWVPFVESMNVDIAATRLKAGNIDAMARIQKDEPTSVAANANDLLTDEW